MTRPNIRLRDRKRCNLAKDLHRLDCTGHEASRSSRIPRVVAQQIRREREKVERISSAQRARVQKRYNVTGDKRLMSPPEHESAISEDTDAHGLVYPQKRATGVLRQAAVMSPRSAPERPQLIKCSKCPDWHISEARAHGLGYCHGYRLPTEHYHENYEALAACAA